MNFVILLMISVSLCLANGAGQENSTIDQEVVVPINGHINASETQSLNFTVGPDVASASFILTWGKTMGNLDMALITPSGMQVDPASDVQIIYKKNIDDDKRNMSMLFYIVPEPETGDWTAEITATAVPEMGADYTAFIIPTGEEGAIPESPDNLSVIECEDCAQE